MALTCVTQEIGNQLTVCKASAVSWLWQAKEERVFPGGTNLEREHNIVLVLIIRLDSVLAPGVYFILPHSIIFQFFLEG